MRGFRSTRKERITGDFHRSGKTFTAETVETFDHDFGSAWPGELIPHGICDMANHHAHIHLTTSHDTSELCDSVALQGARGPSGESQATRLLRLGTVATAHAVSVQGRPPRASQSVGAGNSCGPLSAVLFQAQPDRTPGVPASITRACQGVIYTVDIARQFIALTKTTTGLRVTVRLLDKVYQTGAHMPPVSNTTIKIALDDHLPGGTIALFLNAHEIGNLFFTTPKASGVVSNRRGIG